MEDNIVFSGKSEDEIWQKIENDLNREEPFQYEAMIHSGEWKILLDIDIDLGGGFEGGYAMTTFSSVLLNSHDFRFAIHREDFIDEIGKFFGMQDVTLGFKEFDRRMIVKTNDEAKTKSIFDDNYVREALLTLDDFSFGIVKHKSEENLTKQPFLELVIDSGLTDPKMLKDIYIAFVKVLHIVDKR